MTITERSTGLLAILDLDGKLTLGDGAQLLKDKVNSLVLQGRREVIVNLAKVTAIDSSGLGEIVACLTTVKRGGGRLKLLHLNSRHRDLLSITKLLTVFEVYDAEEEATRSFN